MKVYNYLNQDFIALNHKAAMFWSLVTIAVWSYFPFMFVKLTFESLAFVVAALGVAGLLFGYLVQFLPSGHEDSIATNTADTDVNAAYKNGEASKSIKTSHKVAMSLCILFAALWSPLILSITGRTTENTFLVSGICILLGLSLGYWVASMAAKLASLNIQLKSLSQ
jgi:hypothetical protein